MTEDDGDEQWTTTRDERRREHEKDPDVDSPPQTQSISSLSEALRTALWSFESRAQMYARLKRAHGNVLDILAKNTEALANEDRSVSASTTTSSEEYEKALAEFSSDMNELNGKMKRILMYLDKEEKEEDEKRVCFLLLKSVQEQEKEKLRLTTIQMALKTHFEMKKWSWQQDGYVEKEGEEEEQDRENAGDALKPTWATHIDGEKNDAYEGQKKCCEPPPEPTKEEYENAMKETTVGLENCIRTINDARDELLEIEATLVSL